MTDVDAVGRAFPSLGEGLVERVADELTTLHHHVLVLEQVVVVVMHVFHTLDLLCEELLLDSDLSLCLLEDHSLAALELLFEAESPEFELVVGARCPLWDVVTLTYLLDGVNLLQNIGAALNFVLEG